jgi:hypothetical protein
MDYIGLCLHNNAILTFRDKSYKIRVSFNKIYIFFILRYSSRSDYLLKIYIKVAFNFYLLSYVYEIVQIFKSFVFFIIK